MSDFKPDLRIAGSDGNDFYAISQFNKNPARLKLNGLQKEIDLWKKGQREWQSACPEARAWFLRSNHDDRMETYLTMHPELHDLEVLQLPALLGLNALGIEWDHQKGENANYELVIENRLLITHGAIVRKYSAYTARAELEKENTQLSVMTGHTHRGGSYYVRTRKGPIQAHECFCLCNLEPGYIRNPNWQQGIALATVTKSTISIEMIPFFRKSSKVLAQWRDKEYHS